MARKSLRNRVVTRKTWNEVTGWFEVWGEDATGSVFLGHHLKEREADQVRRRAEKSGLVVAGQRWEALFRDRILGFPAHFYYPISEAGTGEEFEHLTWLLAVVNVLDGQDMWRVTCKECGRKRTLWHDIPPRGTLRRFDLALGVCSHEKPVVEPVEEEVEAERQYYLGRWDYDIGRQEN